MLRTPLPSDHSPRLPPPRSPAGLVSRTGSPTVGCGPEVYELPERGRDKYATSRNQLDLSHLGLGVSAIVDLKEDR